MNQLHATHEQTNVQEHSGETRPPSAMRYRFSIIVLVAAAQIKMASRYPGAMAMDVLLPIIVTTIPVFLGNALTRAGSAQAFADNTGTPAYAAYVLIGSSVFFMVRSALWNTGQWVQREQRGGTLETLYLVPSTRVWFLGGVFLFSVLHSLITFFVSFSLGCVVFAINPFDGNLPLAVTFLVSGIIPLQGISLAYGALVLRFREASALIQIAQWLIGLFMGLYFPVTMLPMLLRQIALLFPPTWINNGVRASLLDIGWITGSWQLDLIAIGVFGIISPCVGYAVFSKIEQTIRRDAGIGGY